MKVWTRGDMDGLTSAVLLTQVEEVSELLFAHPKDVQDGKLPFGPEDVLVNLPYVPGCGLWFDHHISEEGRLGGEPAGYRGRFEIAPSAARVIYNHYRSPKFEAFRDLLEATDRLDGTSLTREDVENPRGWILLGLTLDPRSGLGPDFQKYFRWLVEYVKEVPLEKVLAHYLVKTRCHRVRQEAAALKALLHERARPEGQVVVTDLRGQRDLPAGNRFLVFTLFPDSLAELRVFDGKDGRTVLAAGHNIFNRVSTVNIGGLFARWGGGGHRGAGTCQVAPEEAEKVIAEVCRALQE